MNSTLLYGVDTLLQDVNKIKGMRLAMVTNDAAVTSAGVSSRKALLDAGLQLVVLFSPEHGISRAGEDGAAQADGTDAVTTLPVISLYGDKMKPSPQDLSGIDAVLFDIPDIGCRFYTYLWTLSYVMEICADLEIKLMVLDRPNPIGALTEEAEGPMLDEINAASFLGRWCMPLKHGLTLGELALTFASDRFDNLSLEVVPLQHYQRSFLAGVDFPFVPTSPAMHRMEAALLYPGTGLLEGINVNEGRGTATPFEIFGAPWLNAKAVVEKLNTRVQGDVKFEVCHYTPAASLYQGALCHGVRMSCPLRPQAHMVHHGINLLRTLMEIHPEQVQERLYITSANPAGTGHLDRLLGLPGTWQRLMAGEEISTVLSPHWQPTLLY